MEKSNLVFNRAGIKATAQNFCFMLKYCPFQHLARLPGVPSYSPLCVGSRWPWAEQLLKATCRWRENRGVGHRAEGILWEFSHSKISRFWRGPPPIQSIVLQASLTGRTLPHDTPTCAHLPFYSHLPGMNQWFPGELETVASWWNTTNDHAYVWPPLCSLSIINVNKLVNNNNK